MLYRPGHFRPTAFLDFEGKDLIQCPLRSTGSLKWEQNTISKLDSSDMENARNIARDSATDNAVILKKKKKCIRPETK